MKILGIDPGSLRTGYGLIEVNEGTFSALEYGRVGSAARQQFPQRLNDIYQGLSDVIRRAQPDEIAVEDIFYSRNVKTALRIGHARGVVLLAAARSGVPIAEYSPRAVKQAVVGSGAASKEQVRFMVESILQLRVSPGPGDAADALAVALCHANRKRLKDVISAQSPDPATKPEKLR